MTRHGWVLVLCLASGALAAEPPAVVVVLPPVFEGTRQPEGLGFALQEQANTLLLGKHAHVLHPRQVHSMARHHRMKLETFADAAVAKLAAQRLGAKVFAFTSVKKTPQGFTLTISTATTKDAAATTTSLTLPKGESAFVRQGAAAVASAVRLAQGVHEDPFPTPLPVKDGAVADLASCEALLLEQPLGIEAPTVLVKDTLTRAVGACGAAVKAEPELHQAWAALALAAAVLGDDARALAAIAKARASPLAWSNATLARFWLASRYQSGEAGLAVLDDALKQTTGFMLARASRAELLSALGKHGEAAKAWQDYADHSPTSAFVLSRLAQGQARLGQTKEAVATAVKALGLDPDSDELKLELASRHVDAGQLEEATRILEPLAEMADARAEVPLRLGWVKLLSNDAAGAVPLLERAIAKAKSPHDWRTRGRAKLDLARAALVLQKKADAKKWLQEAGKDGVGLPPPGPEHDALLALLTPAEAATLVRTKPSPAEASPFPVVAGDVKVFQPRQPAPKGFEETMR